MYLSAECADLKDVQHATADDVEAIVLGHPYRSDRVDWCDAHDVVETYGKRGKDFVKDLHGSFAVVICDRLENRVLAATDRAATYPLFLARGPAGLMFSDSIEELCCRLGRVTLDRRALSELLTLCYMLDDRTLLEEVRTVRPATVVEVDGRGHVSERIYWRLSDFVQEAPVDEREVLDLFNDGVHGALETPGEIVLSLSGGLDSRAIMSACMPARERLRCYTFGPARSRDVAIGKRTCRKVGMATRVTPIDERTLETFPQSSERMMRWSNGLVNFIAWSHLPAIYEKECSGAGVHMYGIGGEMLRLYLVAHGPGEVASKADIAGAVVSMGVPDMARALLAGLQADQPDMVRDSVRESLDATGIDEPVLASECWYLDQRMSRYIALSILPAERFCRQYNPFLHTPVLEAVPRLRAEMKRHSRMHRYIVDHNSPELASVILASGELATLRPRRLSTLWDYGYCQARNTARRTLNKASGAIRGEPLVFQGHYNYGGLTARDQRQFVLDTLAPDSMVLADLVDIEAVKDIVGRSLSGSNVAFRAAGNLMSAEMWLKRVGSVADLRV